MAEGIRESVNSRQRLDVVLSNGANYCVVTSDGDSASLEAGNVDKLGNYLGPFGIDKRDCLTIDDIIEAVEGDNGGQGVFL